MAMIRLTGWHQPRRVDLLERPLDFESELVIAPDGALELPLRPFGIESIRLRRRPDQDLQPRSSLP